MKGPLSFKNLINDNQENKEGIIDNVRNCFHLYSVKYYFLYKGTIFLNYKSVNTIQNCQSYRHNL